LPINFAIHINKLREAAGQLLVESYLVFAYILFLKFCNSATWQVYLCLVVSKNLFCILI